MEVIVTNPSNDRKYKIKPDSNGLCYQLWQTTLLSKGSRAKNGKPVKNEWQFTGKYPRDILDGLRIAYLMMDNDPENNDKIEIDGSDLSRLDKYIKKKIKEMADSIEVKE